MLAEEMKDLINDDDEEEDKESDEEVSTKRKHTEGDEDSDEELDDDDLHLLEENLGVKFAPKKKNFKRVRRLDEDDSDKEDEPERARETIANELFDGDDEAPTQRIPTKSQEDDRYADLSGSEESDENDFIVDDEDQPISRPRKKKGIRHNDEQLQQAQELFGVEFDYEDAEAFDEDNYYDEEQEEGYEDEEGVEGGSQRKPRGKKGRKSIFEIYEPTELEKSHLTDSDKEIREADVPERFLLRGIPVKETKDDREIEDEAEWIYTQAFNKNNLTKQGKHGLQPLAGQKDPSAILKIREALKFMRTNFYEVPFIATYKKEYVLPELETSDLWTIYRFDEKFLHLRMRRDNMVKLFTNMKIYQDAKLIDGHTSGAPLLIDDMTIQQVADVTSFEELHDRWLYFQLFYSHDVPEMKRDVEKKERMKRKVEKERKRQELLENLGEGEEVPPEDDDEEDDDETINKRFSTLKLAQRKDFYTSCRESGIKGLAEQYGLTADQLAENIRDNYTKHEVEQATRSPLDVAADFVCTRFPTAEAALKAARFMVAKEISCNPLIRKCIRTVFMERAVVNVRPTEKGLKDGIDETHSCYTQKYLREKHIQDFADDQFLNLLQAEQDGLLVVKVTIDTRKQGFDTVEPYINDLAGLFKKDEFSECVEKWNEERFEALKLALDKMIYPSVEKEMKNKMREEALAAIALKCGENLAELLNVAPYAPPNTVTDDEDFYINEGVRVLGFAFSTDMEESCFAALIDGDGEVIEYLRLPHFMMRARPPGMEGHSAQNNYHLKEKDNAKLKSFIVARKPHVIALGAESMDTRRVYTDLDEILTSLTETDQLPKIQVEIVDNDLARVYQSSRRANTDFKEYPGLLRQAISLARRLQDPLIEFAQLCSPDEEILCLKFHQLQSFVPKEQLLEAITIEFINAVNRVGVDVNRAIAHPHTSSLVQFIAGFGPRKAAAFLRTLKKLPAQCLESRTQLIMNCKFGAKVFINCAGFIKIDTTQLSDNTTDTYIEVLDSTRVHPEAYEWARKMAVDALEYDDETDVNPAGALEEILENPHRLEDLDLDAFAEELEKQGYGNKIITLYDIRAELSSRFKDPRCPYQTPPHEKLFSMLTRETPETLHKGKLVQGTVMKVARRPPTKEQVESGEPVRAEDERWMCPFCLSKDFDELNDVWSHFDSGLCPGPAFGVSVRLDNGVFGFVKTENLSDSNVDRPEDRVRVGMVVNARILEINPSKFSIQLTCKSSHLNDADFQFRPTFDPAFDHEAELLDNEARKEKKKKQQKKTYIKRIIVHPAFQNIDFLKAEKLMTRMSQGDCIIRPSSKGPDHLTLTWKVHKGITQHVDIIEKNKDNPFGLGKQLIINGEVYEDLDEIIARYVNPMSQFARDLINFRYFRNAEGGLPEKMEEYLNEARASQPNKIHYFIAASKERAGKFLLSYLPRTRVMHEYVTVTPEGFRYRQRIFNSVNQLFKWFKEHFRDPPPQPTPVMATPVMGTPGGILLTDRPGSAQPLRTPTQTPMSNFGGHVRPPGNYFPSPMAAPRTPAQQTPGGSWIKPPGMPMREYIVVLETT